MIFFYVEKGSEAAMLGKARSAIVLRVNEPIKTRARCAAKIPVVEKIR